jgi:ribosomal subunit interface protein
MEHSSPLESHAHQKIEKIKSMFSDAEAVTPFFVELWLKAHKTHPHHGAELHLKAGELDLHAHEEGTDMYVVVDNTIDKIVEQIKKHRALMKNKSKRDHKEESEKGLFTDDKYTLGD